MALYSPYGSLNNSISLLSMLYANIFIAGTTNQFYLRALNRAGCDDYLAVTGATCNPEMTMIGASNLTDAAAWAVAIVPGTNSTFSLVSVLWTNQNCGLTALSVAQDCSYLYVDLWR